MYEIYTPNGFRLIQKNIPLTNTQELKCNIIANQINHPAFIHMYKYSVQSNYIKLIFESGMCNLKQFYELHDISEKIELSALLQLLSAIYYYSDVGIVHNDLFFRNVIVLDSDYESINVTLMCNDIKIPVYGYIFCIADFGMSSILANDCDFKVDLMSLFKSFFHYSKSDIIKSIVRNMYDDLLITKIESCHDIMEFVYKCMVKVVI